MFYSEIKQGDALAGNLAAMKVRNEIQLAHMTQIEAVSFAAWDCGGTRAPFSSRYKRIFIAIHFSR